MRYLIWSNREGGWWRPGCNGFTRSLDEAGYFTREDAERLVAQATCNGVLSTDRVDPFTGRRYRQADEVMMPEPQMAVVS